MKCGTPTDWWTVPVKYGNHTTGSIHARGVSRRPSDRMDTDVRGNGKVLEYVTLQTPGCLKCIDFIKNQIGTS